MAEKSTSQKKEKKLTIEQQKCLDERNKNLLVSASAGSGKTFIMIERIKNLIINKEASVLDLLVVTFTKASALEMKARLVAGLEKLPEKDDYIKQQLFDVNIANICTLHSFCARLLKTYFYEVGLDPSFIMIDEIEGRQLKEKALTKLIDNAFMRQDEKFFTLYEMFSSNRKEDNFRELIISFYEYALNMVDFDRWFEEKITSAYDLDLKKNICANFINSTMIEEFTWLKQRADELLEQFNNDKEEKLIAYLNTLYVNLLKIKENNDFEQNRKNSIMFEPIVQLRVKCEKEENKELLKEFRDSVASAIKKAETLYFVSNDKFMDRVSVVKDQIIALKSYVDEFADIYGELKREKVALDYSDLERFILQLLSNSEIQQVIKERFKYVFVDEYQDINEVQEAILQAVSGADNLFMVGDVKQSIYRFRGSEPQIFVDKYNRFKTNADQQNMALDLNCNFRSNKDILDFCNEVFARSMTSDFGGVDYAKNSMLVKGGDNVLSVATREDPVVSINLIETVQSRTQLEEFLEPYSVKKHKNEDEEVLKRASVEGNILAQKINELVKKDVYIEKDGEKRKLGYNDITVLTISRGEYLEVVLKELTKQGIPYSSDIKQDIFDEYNMNVLKSLLELIENRYNDIALLAVLGSDVFTFSLNDLAIIRKNDKTSKFFYQAFENSLNNEGVPSLIRDKVFDFINTINKFNFISKFTPVDELIKRVIKETKFKEVVLQQENGDVVMSNITKLLNFLNGKNYNESLTKFLETLKENPICFEEDSFDNGVKITTIHQSKGLEYPVVMLIGAGRQLLNSKDRSELLFSRKLGPAIPYFNLEEHVKSCTLNSLAISNENESDELKEKLRLLYVALTRAVNYLFIFGRVGQSTKLVNHKRAKTFLDWIMPVVQAKQNGGMLTFSNFEVNYFSADDTIDLADDKEEKNYKFGVGDENFKSTISKVLNYEYPYKKSTEMPVKTSVSELIKEDEEQSFIPKLFGGLPNELAIEKGLAYHRVMQHIALDITSEIGVKEAMERLVSEGVLFESDLQTVNYVDIFKLINSTVIKDCIKSYSILREKEFIALTKLPKLKGEQTDLDSVVLQGVVDLVAINKNKAIVIDFKTNNWKKEENYINTYKKQLDMYAKVIAESYKIKDGKEYIYSFNMGKFIPIN